MTQITDASCSRCSRRSCRGCFVKQSIVVAPIQPQTIILQNNYPAPLSQAGASVFGYSSGNYGLSTQFTPIDVNLFANLEARIATQALSNISSLQSEGILATNILAETLGRAALIQSATAQLVTALGTTQTAPTSLRLIFDGQSWRVDNNFINSLPNPIKAPTLEDQANLPLVSGLTVFLQRCISCHVKDTNPNITNIDDSLIVKAFARMRLPIGNEKHMPKGGELTNEEKNTIVNELMDYRLQIQ